MVGLTMEGIELSPVVFDLMMENAFRGVDDPDVNITTWTSAYVDRRYAGQPPPVLHAAWQILMDTVSYLLPCSMHIRYGVI